MYERIYVVSLYLCMIIMSFSAKRVIDNNRFISSILVSGWGGGHSFSVSENSGKYGYLLKLLSRVVFSNMRCFILL